MIIKLKLFILSLFVLLFSSNSFAIDDIKLYVFDCGKIINTDLSVFTPGENENVKKELSNSCYLIVHPKGTLLWDTGLNDDLPPEGISIYNGVFELSVRKKLKDQLKEIGYKPSDIDFIAISHFHSDHVGNANNFTKATHIIQTSEYSAVFGQQAEALGFDISLYGNLRNNKTIKITGDYDVFGDGKVIIKRAIGHTPGHQALFVDLKKEGALLISGDLWHFQMAHEKRTVPSFNFNKEDTLESMKNIDAFIKEKDAKLIIQHDKPSFDKLKHAPDFYM